MMKKVLLFLMCMLNSMFALAQLSDVYSEITLVKSKMNLANDAETISFEKDGYILELGEVVSLNVAILPESSSNKTIYWKSSNENVATVTSKGVVKGVSGGMTVITASIAGSDVHATCTVVVDAPITDYNFYLKSSHTGSYSMQRVNSYVRKSFSFYIDNNGPETINITRLNIWKNNGTLIGSNSDSSILGELTSGTRKTLEVTVNEDIPLESYSYEWFYTCKGRSFVKHSTEPTMTINIMELALEPTDVVMKVSETQNLEMKYRPTIATDKRVTWMSADKNIATVDENGLVTAQNVGETDVFVSANGGATAICHVTVLPELVDSIAIDPTSIEVEVGGEYKVSAVVFPENATNKELEWSSSNTDIATVSSEGVVTGLKEGTVVITAKAKDGSGIQCSCAVTVLPVLVEAITLNYETFSLEVGEAIDLEANVLPDNATNKTIEWISSDESVAKVDQDGHVVCCGEGEAVISAIATDGGDAEATCLLSCTNGIIKIEVDNSNVKVYDTNGKMLSSPKNGINIVMKNNGVVKKVIIK